MRLTGEVLYPSEIRIDLISLDSERGTADVDSCEVRKQFAILLLQLRMGPRDTQPHRAGLPDAQEPEPVKSQQGNLVKVLIRNIVECCGAAEDLPQFIESYARVDLV